MTSLALRVYTTTIALVCGAAVAWSIHQGSVASAWQADARSWHALAAEAVAHDRHTSRNMRSMIGRYDRLVIRTRRSQQKLIVAVEKARAGAAAAATQPALASFGGSPLPAASAPVPVPVAPAPAPTTHTSPAP